MWLSKLLSSDAPTSFLSRSEGNALLSYLLPAVFVSVLAAASVGGFGEALERPIASRAEAEVVTSDAPTLASRAQAGVVRILAGAKDVHRIIPDADALAKIPKKFWKQMGSRELVVTDTVFDAVDELARQEGSLGTSAGAVIDFLESKMRDASRSEGELRIPVNDEGGLVRFVVDSELATMEDLIHGLAKREAGTMLTNDGRLLLRAERKAVPHIKPTELYEVLPGGTIHEITGPTQRLTKGFFDFETALDLPVNAFIRVKDRLARVVEKGRAMWLPDADSVPNLSGVMPRNDSQRTLFAALQSPDLEVVSVAGEAGAGKTFLALAHGLEELEKGNIEKLVFSRPLARVGGQNVGFLPGDLDAKLQPLREAVEDAIASLPNDPTKKAKDQLSNKARVYLQNGKIEIADVGSLRGRNLRKTQLVIDEAQNFDAETLLTIIGRKDNSDSDIPPKVLLAYDIAQRDSAANAGSELETVVLEGFRGESFFAEVLLTGSQRGGASAVAARTATEYAASRRW